MEKKVRIKKEDTTLYVRLDYELSTANAASYQELLSDYCGQDIRKVVFDATDLVYISSSGIRVLLFAQNRLGNNPEIVFLNCAKEIFDTLELTGITNFFTFIEDERKNGSAGSKVSDDKWLQKMADTRQKLLDHFSANNDVVMYQMRLGETED